MKSDRFPGLDEVPAKDIKVGDGKQNCRATSVRLEDGVVYIKWSNSSRLYEYAENQKLLIVPKDAS